MRPLISKYLVLRKYTPYKIKNYGFFLVKPLIFLNYPSECLLLSGKVISWPRHTLRMLGSNWRTLSPLFENHRRFSQLSWYTSFWYRSTSPKKFWSSSLSSKTSAGTHHPSLHAALFLKHFFREFCRSRSGWVCWTKLWNKRTEPRGLVRLGWFLGFGLFHMPLLVLTDNI